MPVMYAISGSQLRNGPEIIITFRKYVLWIEESRCFRGEKAFFECAEISLSC
jgi:hypothetical protein